MEDKQRIILGSVVIVFVIVLAFSFQSNITPYKSVSEVAQKENVNNVQVNGTIVENSTKYFQNNNTRIFGLTDGKSEITVVYTGIISNYQEGMPAVAIGDYSHGKIEADEILLKCPSKYESKGEEHPDQVEVNS
ncbi:MAG: cytochrome c maturation protein CcmE [Archaeoglobaceae archaeon]